MQIVVSALIVLLGAWPAFGQPGRRVTPPAPATAIVQIVDPSGGGIPGAVITVKGDAQSAEATTDATGSASFSLPAGSYELVASMDGFDARSETVRLTAGRSRRVQIELPLSRVLETLTVTPEVTGLAETTIGADEIEALADDPEALNDFIRDIGGPDATITVDGFRGGRVPPKDQVAQVIVTTDPYSAQFHEVGNSRVDVITKPGFGEWEGWSSLNFSSDALAARNPFASQKLPFRNLGGDVSASGPLKRFRTSVSLNAGVGRRTETRPLVAITESGLVRNQADQRDDRHSFNVRTTHTIGKEAILRNRIEWESSERVGAGLGDIDLPERAYSSSDHELALRSSLTNQLPSRVRQDIRFSSEWTGSRQSALNEKIAIDVLGAFRSGGAQVTGSRSNQSLELAAEWLFPSRRRHTIRTGALFEHERLQSSNIRNYLGTFVFAGLDAYIDRRPTTYTQRVGSVDIDLADTRAGIFVQDDIRLTPVLTVSLGVRHELQPSIDDLLNLSPRLGLGWTTKSRTTLRFGFGAFYTWHDTSLLEEAQRLDGTQSYELVIRNPGFPDPLVGGSTIAPLPPTRLIRSDDIAVARSWRASTTFEKRFGRFNLRSTVSRQIGRDEPRSRNINAPMNGVRPDLSSGNLLLLGSTGRSQRTSAEVNLNASGFWKRRLFGNLQYTYGQVLNDADSALSLPADSLHPELEWGPSRQDMRHRGYGNLSLRIPRSFNAGFAMRMQTAQPYNITSGQDTNGDTVTNDRPLGVGRNTARGRGVFVTDFHLGWNRTLPMGGGGGPGGRGGPGGGGGGGGGERGSGESRGPQVGFNITARNVFNRPQFGSYNGVITSELFGRPSSANNPRRLDVGMSFSF